MAELEGQQAVIEVRTGEGRISHLPLRGSRMIVGRSPQCEVRLDGQTVSRQHAELYRDPFDRWWVRDLGSRNGTYVNGQKRDEQVLSFGDTIQIEQFVLVLRASVAETSQRTQRKTTMNVTLTDARNDRIQNLRDFEAPKIGADHLSKLTEFGSQLLATPLRERRLELLCKLMVGEQFHGRAAVVLRLQKQAADANGEQEPEPLSDLQIRPGTLGGDAAPYVSKTTLRAVRDSETAIIASNAPEHAGDSGGQRVELSLAGNVNSMSAVACPLRSDSTVLDVLYVTFPAQFGTGEWLSLVSLAAEEFAQSDMVWEARVAAQQHAVIERELERGRRIQDRLLPRDLDIAHLEVAIGFEPCRWVGGDYVDVLPLADGRIFLTVADVCGKGLQAALVSASLHSMMHTNVQPGFDLAALVDRLNRYLCGALPDDSFVTFTAVLLDAKTGELSCINAGHPPAMIFAPGCAVEHLQAAEHPPLGFDVFEPRVQQATLPEQAVLALYTDGLSEMIDGSAGEMLGIDGLARHLHAICAEDAAAPVSRLAESLQQRLSTCQGTHLAQDDQTFLLARRKSGA